METVDLYVPNISCGHCVATIERVVGELPGVEAVKADKDTRHVTVAFSPPATREGIVAALKEWDYPPAD